MQQRNAEIRLHETEAEATRLAADQVRQIERDAERTQAEAKRLRAEELVAAERAKQLKTVESNAQREMIGLYAESPVLVDLEKLRIELEHEERLTQMQVEAYLKAFEAIAPGVCVHIYGNGGQVNPVMTGLFCCRFGSVLVFSIHVILIHVYKT